MGSMWPVPAIPRGSEAEIPVGRRLAFAPIERTLPLVRAGTGIAIEAAGTMRRVPSFPRPLCHMAHIPNAGAGRAAVWICEYPYRTMKVGGPSSECGDCPVWDVLQHGRRTQHAAACVDDHDEAASRVLTFDAPQAS